MGNRYADHVTPLYPQKLALTSPTGGGRSVGMVRSRTEATEFSQTVVKIVFRKVQWPITVTARSKKWLCDGSLAGIVGSNPTGGMDICLL